MGTLLEQDIRIAVLCGCSGSGKTTVMRDHLLPDPQFNATYARVISCTSRKPRDGEVDGDAYRFFSRRDFEALITAGGFLEFATYNGEYYGTLKTDVDTSLKVWGKPIFKDLELNGAQQVRVACPLGLGIFLCPTSIDELKQALRDKRGMGEEEICRRVEVEAVREMATWQDICHVRVMSKQGDITSMVRRLKPLLLDYAKDPAGTIARFTGASIEERTLS